MTQPKRSSATSKQTPQGFLWDPVRRQNVVHTPEEAVRQKLIAWLNQVYQIPFHRMQSEVAFKGEVKVNAVASKGENRADLVVWETGEYSQPWLLAECKRPGIKLDESVLDQVRRYTRLITPKFVLLTNGSDLRIFEKYERENTEADSIAVGYRECEGLG